MLQRFMSKTTKRLQQRTTNCLLQIELYFLQDAFELRSPLNLRNEAAALSLLLPHFATRGGESPSSEAIAAEGDERASSSQYAQLLHHCEQLWPGFQQEGGGAVDQPPATYPAADSVDAEFEG
jgi:hypothetical protein